MHMIVDPAISPAISICLDLLDCFDLAEHFGSANVGMPPQRSEFPDRKTPEALRNIPSLGTSPWSILFERFKNLRYRRVPSKRIEPVRLFNERSINSTPFKFAIELGIDSPKVFLDRSRYIRFLHSPKLEGIGPESLFLEKSKRWTIFKLPISEDKLPVREFHERFSEFPRLWRVKMSLGMKPLRPFRDRSKSWRLRQFERLDGKHL